jgi:hypothetical protein
MSYGQPYSFGMQTQRQCAETVNKKDKIGKTLCCNRVTTACLETQCEHKTAHVCTPDCFEKYCYRNQREIPVECKIVEVV